MEGARMRAVVVNWDDLKRVLDYLWVDEERHYEETGRPARHILGTLRSLKIQLDGVKPKRS